MKSNEMTKCADCKRYLTDEGRCPKAAPDEWKCNQYVHFIESNGNPFHDDGCPACKNGYKQTDWDE